MNKPTLEDVARHAGVSIATASRVLNNGGSDEAREAVMSAIAELGYKRHRAPHKLVSLTEYNKQASEICRLKLRIQELERENDRLYKILLRTAK